jgi:hypothetical protein
MVGHWRDEVLPPARATVHGTSAHGRNSRASKSLRFSEASCSPTEQGQIVSECDIPVLCRSSSPAIIVLYLVRHLILPAEAIGGRLSSLYVVRASHRICDRHFMSMAPVGSKDSSDFRHYKSWCCGRLPHQNTAIVANAVHQEMTTRHADLQLWVGSSLTCVAVGLALA